MTTVRRPKKRASGSSPAVLIIFIVLFGTIILLSLDDPKTSTTPSSLPNGKGPSLRQRVRERVPQNIKTAVQHKRQQISSALKSLTESQLPNRLRTLRQRHEIVGERLSEVKAGTATVAEILHGHDLSHHNTELPPMKLDDIIKLLDNWIHQLHETLVSARNANFEGIWQAYHDLAVKTLYPWDRDYLRRMPPRRDDGSIFLSVATYRE